MTRDRIVKSRKESIYSVYTVARIHVTACGPCTGSQPVGSPGGLECSDDRGSNSYDSAATCMSCVDRVGCCFGDAEYLRIEDLMFYGLIFNFEARDA